MKQITRHFKIKASTHERLDSVSQYFGLHQNTLGAIAIIHGIQYVEYGFVPKYKGKKNIAVDTKEDIRVTLPEDTWKKFDELIFLHSVPRKYLFEIFLNIELKKYTSLIEYYENQKNNNEENKNNKTKKNNNEENKKEPTELIRINENFPKGLATTERTRLTFKNDVSKIFYYEIKNLAEANNITDKQLICYLLTNGIIEEHRRIRLDAYEYDKELLQMIDDLNLDRAKALTLIAYVLKYKPRF